MQHMFVAVKMSIYNTIMILSLLATITAKYTFALDNIFEAENNDMDALKSIHSNIETRNKKLIAMNAEEEEEEDDFHHLQIVERLEEAVLVPSNHYHDFSRQLQETRYKCFSTNDERNPNRYCTFENAPREGTFLMLACPDSKGEDLTKCGCTIGAGNPDQAPIADTCNECAFCTDGTFAYDCRNVAEGTCIGRNCRGQCISSQDAPEDIMIEDASNGCSRQKGLLLVVYGILMTVITTSL